MRILIGYDGSASADQAVSEVLRRSWPTGSEVRLVTALTAVIVPPVAGGVEYYGPVWEKARAVAREQAHERLMKVLEGFRGRPDLTTSYELRDEDPKTALLGAAREWHADLLILGSQGTTALGRLFVGSVCHAMVSHAPCSVEVVRGPIAA
jgi:nucleotide-binding universal stress UspA family protein